MHGKGTKAALIVLYVAALALFYYKYVPIVRPFQMALLPVLVGVAALTWRNFAAGTLGFLFLFPLINNLPYFFGIAEPIPHAPTALVLFLAYFLGVMFSGRSLASEAQSGRKLECALHLFLALVVVSGVVGFLRFANFWPFSGYPIYELTTNRFGVRSGGAIMSIVFSLLNYASGIAFFLIARGLLRKKDFLRKALVMLGASSLIALAFGLFQKFGHITFGNNPTSIRLHLINGTFKDALSFGTYLSLAVPLFLGVALTYKERLSRILAAIIVLGSLFTILFTGSKSGLGGLAIALAAFLGLALSRGSERAGGRRPGRAGPRVSAGAKILIGVVIAGAVAGVFLAKAGGLSSLKKTPMYQRLLNSRNMLNWRVESLWKPALRMMADYPLAGVGIGSFIIEVANYSDLYQRPPDSIKTGDYYVTPESAENYILQVVSELGAAGLLVWGWILVLILRQIRSGHRAVRRTAWKYLYWGALCALISFAVNAQTHTFIGSYEIKYTAWLLVGLIFAVPIVAEKAGREENKGKTAEDEGAAGAIAVGQAEAENTLSKSASAGRGAAESRHPGGEGWKKALLPALVLLFGVVHLWNSTHSLSLAARTKKFDLDRSFGLGRIEKGDGGREFRWIGRAAGISVTIGKPALVIPIHASHPDISKKPITVSFELIKDFFKTKKMLKEVRLTDQNWTDIELPVGTKIGNDALILIKVDRTWNPLKTTGVPDPRDLGIAVGKIEFK